MRLMFVFILLLLAPLTHANAEQLHKGKVLTAEVNAYRKIYKVGYQGNYIVTGEANPKNSALYYSVEDGHVLYIREQKVMLKGKTGQWCPFKIMVNLPKTALPDNGAVIITIYQHDQNNRAIHSHPIVLEQFYH